ncbi:MAG TPA: HNH endonuclease [Candidatus Onthovicinus excrementipullorum]|nr:HNH endonuclease [Candidatus Onthovicinus excrementipullorum]
MANRDFSDSVKLSAITENLRKNNGEICCAICGTKISSINECHFDHIFPFAKGGKSTAENCQILCISCNLKKTDKILHDFLLEEKAKQFFAGEVGTTPVQDLSAEISPENMDQPQDYMSKEAFDQAILSFITRKGDIHKVDFGREYNHLPSIHYVRKYYGDLRTLKKAFGVEDLSVNWSREAIKATLERYIEQNGDILQKDLTKKNKLPSLPCILGHYPEYKSFTDIKKNMLNLTVRSSWDVQSVIRAGKDYVEKHGKITESSLRAENNLPTARVVYNYFGSLAAYQQAVGSAISQKNDFISEEEIENAVNQFFGEKERVVVSMKEFFKSFPYSSSTIHKRFGSFATFCQKHNINVKHSKKAKYTKQEVDDAVAKWVKAGKEIPAAKELSRLGLPSMSVILKYYENWKEPFVLYRKLYDKLDK